MVLSAPCRKSSALKIVVYAVQLQTHADAWHSSEVETAAFRFRHLASRDFAEYAFDGNFVSGTRARAVESHLSSP